MTVCRPYIAGVGLWLATALVDSAWAQSWNMYQGSTSLQLQYTGGDLNVVSSGVYSNNPAKISVNILGNRIDGMIIDTGSTGIAISASLLPSLAGYTPLGPGTINYDSSGASPTGTFYQLPVSLLGGTSGGSAAPASTTVKVLVVTSDNTTTYFGIGNNRNNVYSGTPNASLTFAQNVAQGIITPISAVGMNPLLNVSVNGTALPNQGYVVMNNQIVVGLTTANNGYSFVKLTPDAANGPNLWNGIPVSLTVGAGAAGAGTILHDTGIDYAFLVPFGQTGQTVSVAMPGASPTGALYDFIITRGTTATACATPASATMTPCHVEASTSSTPFLNTGRQFFAGLNYLFDPVNGFVGYALSDSGLTTTATVTPLLALTGTVSLKNGFSTDFNTYLMANTTLSQTGTGTFSSTISGSGGLTIAGGTVNLLGTNTFTGGTTIASGGTLRAGADAAMGAVSGGLTFTGGTLQATSAFTVARQVSLATGGGTIDTNGNNILVSTAIAGSGGLTKAGTGILTVSGANSYVGGTTINAGTLRLAAGASLPTTGALTVTGGTLDFNGNNVTIGSLAGAGGTLSLGASTLTVAEAGSTTFAGTLTGTGGSLVKQGSGTLNLTGANTYTGPTTVSGGRLAVNGSITSNVTVGSGGNLGGAGTITGTVTNSGTLAPGNSIGTLSVVGSYTQAAGSTYQVETNAAGQADRINVTGAPGTATINGGTVAVLPDASGPYAMSTTYTILNATGGVSGAFANATSSLPFLQPSLSYDNNNAYLTLKPGGFAMGAQSTNQAAVGRVLDRSVAGATGDFATVIGTLATFSLAQGQAAMDAISGQNYSGFSTANLGGGLMFMNALGQQMSQARGGSGSGSRVALAQACDVACDGEGSGPWSLWGSALGGTGSIAGNGNASTLTYNAGGVATGADYRVDPRFLVGLGIGFASGNQYLSGFSGRGTSNSYQASLYASFTQTAFYLDAQAGYGYNDNQMTRQIIIPGLQSRTATGRTGANQFLGQVEAGYKIDIYQQAAASLTPFARLQATTVNQAAFNESGASSLSLNVAQQTTNSVRTVLGAELAGTIDAGWRDKLALQFRLGWAHEYADTSRPVTASFAGAPGAAFTVFGAAPQRDAAAIGLAANTAIAERTSLYFRYDGEVGTGTDSHAFSAGLRMTW
ncbi:MAG: autotransporter outer membrane beta-barrel domain-containing protein [Reyranella sp.]